MSVENTPPVDLSGLEKLCHNVVSDWTEVTNITLRPADKAALKKIICQSLPAYFEENQEFLTEKVVMQIREQERQKCIEAIANLDEPISGLINKQRTLNACTYLPQKSDCDQ